jgi:hypothetical protein
MVRITGEERIRRPPEIVFDRVADSRNESAMSIIPRRWGLAANDPTVLNMSRSPS